VSTPDPRAVNLEGLAEQLRAFAAGLLTREALERWVAPVIDADPLHVEASDSTPWDSAPDDARLFWRLVYLFDCEALDVDVERRLAGRVVRCLERTGSAATTFELLPVLVDQDRLCTIAARHARGIISRTGFLSVIAESGYPPHLKLWLEHAPARALARLCGRLGAGEYDTVAASIERPPV